MISPVFAGPTFEKKRLEGVFSCFECHTSIKNDAIMLSELSTFNLTFWNFGIFAKFLQFHLKFDNPMQIFIN